MDLLSCSLNINLRIWLKMFYVFLLFLAFIKFTDARIILNTQTIFSILNNSKIKPCSIFFVSTKDLRYSQQDHRNAGILSEVYNLSTNVLSVLDPTDPRFKEFKDKQKRLLRFKRFSGSCSVSLIFVNDIEKIEPSTKALVSPPNSPLTIRNRDYYIFIGNGEILDKILLDSFVSSNLRHKIAVTILNSSREGFLTMKTMRLFCNHGRSQIFEVKGEILFSESDTKNFHGKKLIASIVANTTTGIMLTKVEGKIRPLKTGGHFLQSFITASKHLNFTFELIPSSGDGAAGSKNEPGSSSAGMVTQILNRKVDVGVVGGVTQDRLHVIDICSALEYLSLIFVRGPPRKIVSWGNILWPLDGPVWISYFAIVLATILILKIFSYFWGSVQKEKLPDLAAIMLASTFSQIYKPQRVIWLNIFLSFWHAYVIVMSTAYSSKLYQFFTMPQTATPPETFEQLANSTYQIGFGDMGGTIYNYFNSSSDVTKQRIFTRLEKVNVFQCFINSMNYPDYACISYFGGTENILKPWLPILGIKMTQGKIPLVVSQHPAYQFPVSFVLEKNSILYGPLSRFGSTCFESGLIVAWRHQTAFDIREEVRAGRFRIPKFNQTDYLYGKKTHTLAAFQTPPIVKSNQLRPLMQKLSPCLTEIYEFAPVIDYSQLRNPFLLTNPEFARAGNTRKIYNPTIRSSHRCKSVLILLPSDDSNINPLNFTTYSGKKLDLSYNYFNEFYRAPIYPESIYGLQIQSSKEFHNNVTNTLNFVNVLFDISPPYAPPVFVLLFNHPLSPQNGNAAKFWFACEKCVSSLTPMDLGLSLKIFEFVCSSMENCYDAMITAYRQVIDNGRNVAFIPSYNDLATDHIMFTTLRNKRPSPFSRDFPAEIHEAVEVFLIEDLNSSLYQDYISLMEFYPCPVTFHRLRAYKFVEMFHAGMTEPFKFMTPDKVTNVKMSFASFWKPFGNKVWIALVIATLIMSLLTIHEQKRFIVSHTFWWGFKVVHRFVLLWLVMIDQKVSFPKMKQLTVGIYILMMLIITMQYKAFLKSDVTVTTPYETKWEYIEQLNEFSLYLLLSDKDCPSTELLTIEPNHDLCRKLRTRNSDPCYFYSELLVQHSILGMSMYHHQGYSEYEIKKLTLLRKLEANTFLLCLNQVQNILKGRSTKIAFIIPEKSFEFYRQILQEKAEGIQGHNLNLGHNQKVQDRFLVLPHHYSMTGGLHELNQVVPKRMRSLLTSGIYDLWARWDAIRFSKNQLQGKIDTLITFVPLGLFTSNIHLIFYVLCLAYFVSLVCLCIQNIFHSCMQLL
ncbi:unnamed protein product [Allacma fusca]|uniref:Ionotropic receptor n=1 Tax=Allacma fusca TaxID=39272 RepID=A0A8J2NXS6_9HEXA|nr:unnamed protein product [Allacma fusca]